MQRCHFSSAESQIYVARWLILHANFTVTWAMTVSPLTRAKLFRGKKVFGDYDIKVEQVCFTTLLGSV